MRWVTSWRHGSAELNVGAPTFIPFFGAWIVLKDKPMNAETEAYVGLAGPVAGTIGAVVCFFLGWALSSNLLLALSYAGLFINLFNLVPVSPFDGGRITQVLSPRIWLIGAPILLAMFVWQRNPLLIVMLILAAPQVVAAFHFDPKAPANASYHATINQNQGSIRRFISSSCRFPCAGELRSSCHAPRRELRWLNI